MAFLLALFSPFKLWIGGAAIVLLIIGGIYTYGRSAGKSAVIEKINRDNANAKKAADEARDRAERDFAAGRLRDDGWKREGGL
jgi:hypothetical protein